MARNALRELPVVARALLATGALLGATITLTALVGGDASAQSDGAATEIGEALAEDTELVQRGAELFGTHCALCHGEEGRGLPIDGPSGGPSLVGAGPAAVDFMLRTGRMPMSDAQDRMQRRPQQFSDEDRRALTAYVEQLDPGQGPEIPDIDDWRDANLTRGQQLFTTNCAACHGPTGQGVAVGQQDVSSSLDVTAPIEIATAIRSGPGVMPRFTQQTLSEEDLLAVIGWVMDLRERETPGGWSFGRSGTVTEGLIAVGGGLGLLTLVMYVLGDPRRDEDEPSSKEPAAGGEG